MKKQYTKHLISLLLFGSNGVIASFVSLNSYEIVLCRTLLGSAFLIALFLIFRVKLTFYKYKKEFLFLCGSGIAMGASWMLLYEAFSRIGVSLATICYYTGPVIVMILSPVLFNEKLSVIKIIGFLVVLFGVILINSGSDSVINDRLGFIIGLLSAVTYALMVILNKKAYPITGLENSMLQLIISCITVSVFVIFKQGFNFAISYSDLLPIAVIGILNTGFGCYLFFSSIGSLPVQTVSIFGYLEPLSAMLFSALILKERLNFAEAFGAVLIFGGAIFAECFKRNKIKQ